jgi:hypothetical protein
MDWVPGRGFAAARGVAVFLQKFTICTPESLDAQLTRIEDNVGVRRFKTRRCSMRALTVLVMGTALVLSASQSFAKEVSGEYIEARTCDVYTGPCFANGEVGISGRKAVLGWKVDTGSWQGVSLEGLSVAMVVSANDTLGIGGSFYTNPTEIEAILILDERATRQQQAALENLVLSSVKGWTPQIVGRKSAPISLKSDHLSGVGEFEIKDLVRLQTRQLSRRDCVCSNEVVFYPPLASVENSQPVFTRKLAYTGNAGGGQWNSVNRRSAFLATFEK